MLRETGKSPAELRRMVTSPGGTTEAAIRVLEDANFGDLIKRVVDAAVKRAEELGR
jgi:pyrroline-5-carboxylate reductase